MAETLLSPEQLADYLGISVATVYQLNHKKAAPRRMRVGKHVRYRKSDVDAWLDSRSIDPSPAERR